MADLVFGNIGDFVTNPDLETEGVTFKLGNGLGFKLRRAGGANRPFSIFVAEQFKLKKDELENASEDESEQISRSVMYPAYARFVVLEWFGFKEPDGKDIQFSAENCMRLFTQSREIYEHIVTQSNKLANYRYKEVFEAGNVLQIS